MVRSNRDGSFTEISSRNKFRSIELARVRRAARSSSHLDIPTTPSPKQKQIRYN